MAGEAAPYPRDRAGPVDVPRLADADRKAGGVARLLKAPRDPASRAAVRVTSIHAIGRYLDTLPRARGRADVGLRAMHHDLDRRACHPAVAALKLRRRTAAHRRALTVVGGYVHARYEPEAVEAWTRPKATLDEVARKVTAAPSPARPGPDKAPSGST